MAAAAAATRRVAGGSGRCRTCGRVVPSGPAWAPGLGWP